MASKKSDESKSTLAPVKYIAVPHRWLIVLLAVLVLPWLWMTATCFRPEKATNIAVEDTDPVKTASAGKWGKLTLVPIIISPPMELVFTDWGFMRRPTWFFPRVDADAVAQFLQSSGVSPEDAARLRSKAQFDARISGVILAPDPAWVRGLSPDTRANIYRMLAKSRLNIDQTLGFRYPGTNPEEWFGPSLISQHTRELIEPLIYRDGGYMQFCDIELVRSEIGGEDELRKLGKALFRQPTFITQLSIDPSDNLDELIEYWGRGGRRTDIRPLIESLAARGSQRSIDIINLLPPFIRNHLYRFPKLTIRDMDRPAVVNCLWSSLNFFSEKPDDRFLDSAVALKALKEDYFVVESDFELGDIVAFLDEDGNIFHAAVYIADDIVFSKNGESAMAPWTLMKLNDVKEYYRLCSENPRLIFHRRNDY
ncbi:MAG: hypothetical protein JXA73_04860 [Acidobacteria bacterium]|nr:hypothetical protein [Acidobacteriota bacterium]